MRKILLIEDTKSINEEISTILRFEEYEVIEAFNGREGLEKATHEKPDLIICDVLMPEMDGLSLKKELAKDQTTKSIPFIFFSARVEKEDIKKAEALGVKDYLHKPIDPEILVGRLNDYFKEG
jgi:CheY-like chemotaxis protein